MDLDKSQFLLRSYIQIQLQKIEKYIFHILATAELYNRLSKQEKAFAKTSCLTFIMVWCLCGNKCLVDLEKHLEESVMLKLPNNYQSIFKQSMISEENDMGTHIIFFPHFIHLRVFNFAYVCVCVLVFINFVFLKILWLVL
ncbi:putative GINS subunit, domain A protein [Rosa chinensis]|uniref:Putative GINS subunit, domain A protein n=1 Tax=Rosa chinensis TaxID=74649 RepID=A0A2P6PA46_ROSCH|nr:putative GINS subunit, domain A protein [Rosa chinensis]